MPAIYTHYSFGKKVYAKLPSRLQKIVKKYPSEYKAGLQGPDFLFFYKPFMHNRYGRLGHDIHAASGSDFLKKAGKILTVTGMDSAEGAYILGFICHFMLDSSVHKYVNDNAAAKIASHTLQETEFDRFMMEHDGKDPFACPLYKIPDDSRKLCRTISVFYNGVSTFTVHICERKWKITRKILHVQNPLKQKFLIKTVCLMPGKYSEYAEFVMKEIPDERCEKINQELFLKFDRAVEECVREMIDFCLTVEQRKPLSGRFNITFNG